MSTLLRPLQIVFTMLAINIMIAGWFSEGFIAIFSFIFMFFIGLILDKAKEAE